MKTTISLFALLFFIVGCHEEKKNITHIEDYQSYLTYHQLVAQDPIDGALKFWTARLKKNQRDETSLLKLAGLHAELFKTTGQVNHIRLSDSLLNKVLREYPQGNVSIYHSLSSNAISQHKFQEAKMYAEKAVALKDQASTSLLLLVDASLEVGDYANANQILRQFVNKNSFAYLIRKAKLQDHEGHLDSAILCMEKAYQRVAGNKSLSQWTLSNLADMYGHAGRIEESYAAYLEVLEKNPQDDHVLKGIAWIALSHDHNTIDAAAIINALAVRKRMPDAHLLLAEIASMNGDAVARMTELKKFHTAVSGKDYKTMYNKYLAIIEAEDFDNARGAVAIAREEIANRPTPQSYDLLAWGYYHEQKFKEALEVATKKVAGQSYEPDSFYHLGMIYLATGHQAEAENYLKEALKSEFELGPSVTKKIRQAINNL